MSFLLLSCDAISQETGQLRVSAVVPPRPCKLSDVCERTTTTAPNQQSRLSVKDDEITYVGTTPEVERTDDMLTVLL